MQCPFCAGVPPLYELPFERPHVIQTDFWYLVSDVGPIPEHFMRHTFDAGEATVIAVRYVEKKKGGATLTAHYCVTEGDTTFTIKSRVPPTDRDREALIGFMKDSLRIAETRGRKAAVDIQEIADYARRERSASIRRIAAHFGVDPATVRRTIRAAGKTLRELRGLN